MRTWTVFPDSSSAAVMGGDFGPLSTSSETGCTLPGATRSTSFRRSSVTVRLPTAMSASPSATFVNSTSRVVGLMTTVMGRLPSCFLYFWLM